MGLEIEDTIRAMLGPMRRMAAAPPPVVEPEAPIGPDSTSREDRAAASPGEPASCPTPPWPEEGSARVAAIDVLIAEGKRLRDALEASEEECERLRTEARDLRHQLHAMQVENCVLRNQREDLIRSLPAPPRSALAPR